MEEQIWKDIPNLKGYQASNLGNIRSLNYNKTKQVKELSQYYSSSKNNNKWYRQKIFST